jgi:hypothetical protein
MAGLTCEATVAHGTTEALCGVDVLHAVLAGEGILRHRPQKLNTRIRSKSSTKFDYKKLLVLENPIHKYGAPPPV